MNTNDDFDNGCARCYGQGMVHLGATVARCPRCVVHGRPANPELLPLIAGGQGRTDEHAKIAGESMLLWALMLIAVALVCVAFFAVRGGGAR